jgi:hypothetical protein
MHGSVQRKILEILELRRRGGTYMNISTTPAARIRRVVLDQPAKAADLRYTHASSIVISDGEEIMMVML